MSDSFIKVLESTDDAAKEVDNDAVDYTGTTRYRQRIAVPDGADVAQGSVADAEWSSGDGTIISLLKKIAGSGTGGGPATIADGDDTVEGAIADSAVITDTTGTVNGKLRGLVKWAFERMPASLGQKAMSASLPVVLASDQASVPVAATLSAETTKVIGTVNQGTSPWVTNDPGLPDTLGQKAMSGSTSVALASDQSALPITDNSGSLTVDNGGTFAVQDSQVIADNAGFTDGTSKVFMGGYILDETPGTALTENDAGAARMNANRAQVLVIEDDSTRGRRATVTAGNALKVDASGVAVPITDNSGSLTVDQATASNLLGVAYTTTDGLYNGTTALTPKFAKIAVSSSGANTIVSAVTSKKLRVLSYVLVANGAVNAKWQSHVTPTDLTGLSYLAANGGVSSGFCQFGHFETVSGEALDLNLSGAVAVGGHLTYVEV